MPDFHSFVSLFSTFDFSSNYLEPCWHCVVESQRVTEGQGEVTEDRKIQ